jgi:phage terminase small subunit
MPKLSKTQKLTSKEAAFCLAYVMHFNATRAARAAGYSKKSAHYQGSEILARPRVKAELQRLLAENGITAAEILARLSGHARADFIHFVRFEADGFIRFDFSTDDAKDHMHLIKSIKTRRQRQIVGTGEEAKEWETEWVEIELHDPQRALELLAKAYGLFRDIHLHLNLNMNALTDEQRERLAKGESLVKIVEYEPDHLESEKRLAALLPLPE